MKKPGTPKKHFLHITHPHLLEEYDEASNKGIDFFKIGSGSVMGIWWKCKECSNKWIAKPLNRSFNNSGCPVCSIEKQKRTCIDLHGCANVFSSKKIQEKLKALGIL